MVVISEAIFPFQVLIFPFQHLFYFPCREIFVSLHRHSAVAGCSSEPSAPLGLDDERQVPRVGRPRVWPPRSFFFF